MFVGVHERNGVDHRRAKETLGQDLIDLRGELLEDLCPQADPAGATLQTAGDGALGELLYLVEIGDDVELFAQRRSSPGIVPPQALELSPHPLPGLHDDPHLSATLRLRREEALEAVDEEEPPGLFEDEKRVVVLQRGVNCVSAEELERDLAHGDLSHTAHRSVASGSERTW